MRPASMDHRFRDPGIGIGLADTVEPFIGMNDDDNVILRRRARGRVIIRHQQNMGLNPGDLHSSAPFRHEAVAGKKFNR